VVASQIEASLRCQMHFFSFAFVLCAKKKKKSFFFLSSFSERMDSASLSFLPTSLCESDGVIFLLGGKNVAKCDLVDVRELSVRNGWIASVVEMDGVIFFTSFNGLRGSFSKKEKIYQLYIHAFQAEKKKFKIKVMSVSGSEKTTADLKILDLGEKKNLVCLITNYLLFLELTGGVLAVRCSLVFSAAISSFFWDEKCGFVGLSDGALVCVSSEHILFSTLVGSHPLTTVCAADGVVFAGDSLGQVTMFKDKVVVATARLAQAPFLLKKCADFVVGLCLYGLVAFPLLFGESKDLVFKELAVMAGVAGVDVASTFNEILFVDKLGMHCLWERERVLSYRNVSGNSLVSRAICNGSSVFMWLQNGTILSDREPFDAALLNACLSVQRRWRDRVIRKMYLNHSTRDALKMLSSVNMAIYRLMWISSCVCASANALMETQDKMGPHIAYLQVFCFVFVFCSWFLCLFIAFYYYYFFDYFLFRASFEAAWF
jgi:hypothetical protein